MRPRPGWPAELSAGPVVLRPPRLRDARAWSEVRLRNEQWLTPWEPTSPVRVGRAKLAVSVAAAWSRRCVRPPATARCCRS